jgi:hypothetical protein
MMLVVAVAGLTIFAQSGAGQTTLRRLGVVGPAQRYTELAFVGAQHLPAELPRAPTMVHLAFTITNREGRARSYHWTIFEHASATETRQLMTGQTSVREGQEAYLDPAVTFACTSDQADIDVRLSSGEVIDFIVQCSGPLTNAEVLQSTVHVLVTKWHPAIGSRQLLRRALRSMLANWRPSTEFHR